MSFDADCVDAAALHLNLFQENLLFASSAFYPLGDIHPFFFFFEENYTMLKYSLGSLKLTG